MVTMNLSNANRSSEDVPAFHSLIQKLKFLEEHRKSSFKSWPFGENENCSAQKVCLASEFQELVLNSWHDLCYLSFYSQMAEAGFYHSGTNDDDDSSTCFVCGKVLDSWENTDDPWQEHEKHAPNCAFVKQRLSEDNMTVRACDLIGNGI